MFEKNQRKDIENIKTTMQKYGLEDLRDDRDFKSCKNIAADLAGNKLMEVGSLLKGNPSDAAKMSYLHAIVEQNFIIIRQLDRIASKLDEE